MDFLPDFEDPEIQLLIMMVGGGLLLLVLIGFLLYPRLRGIIEIRRFRQAVAASKLPVIYDAHLLDGHGGFANIDCLILFPVCIAVVGIKNYRGYILGEAEDNAWVHNMGKQRESFLNPVTENDWHVKLVQSVTGTQYPVLGHVLFMGGAKFPKGMPDTVSALPEFLRHLKLARKLPPPSPELAGVWERLAIAVELASDDWRQQSGGKTGKKS